MNITPFTFPSHTGTGEIHGNRYLPEDGRFDTVMAIHHGMAEHQKRYIDFIRFLTERGIGVYMHDMAGHGESVSDPALTGWFGPADGWEGLILDFRETVRRAKEENPDRKLIVMGHSMGSFICRVYTSRYPEDGFRAAIYMGTGGPNPAAGAGLMLSAAIGAIRGKQHRSGMIDRIAFGSYGKRFEGRTGFDWLTRDTGIVDRYIADPLCGFPFTVQGMNDLIRVNAASNTVEWARGVPAGLPILLISGGMDPVGDYGEGVRTVERILKESGHTGVTVKLYPDDRHEVLNELNRDEVMNDIAGWIAAAE